MIRPTGCWLLSGQTYSDLTPNIKRNQSITLLSGSGQALYIGSDRRLLGIYADLSTSGNYTDLSYQFLNDSGAWDYLSLVDSYNFSQSGYLRWELPDKSWVKANLSECLSATATPDTTERYWIGVTGASATYTPAVVSKLRLLPYVEYATPEDVFDFLVGKVKLKFNDATRPSDLVVEDRIHQAEDRIDYETKKSWRTNFVEDEQLDFNRFGMAVRQKNLQKVYAVKLWNGASYDTLNEGRTADYLVDYERGMIYLTRMYLLPAIYGMTGRYSQYNYGEFKNAVLVSYAYGRDATTEPSFGMAQALTIKIATVNLLRHQDYSVLVPSGTDKVPLETKIANLEQEIDVGIDKLAAVNLT